MSVVNRIVNHMVGTSRWWWRCALGFVLVPVLAVSVSRADEPVQSASTERPDENDYYRLVTLELGLAETASRDPNWKPQRGVVPLEISGMQRLPEGRLAVAIRKGEVWRIDNAYEDPAKPLELTKLASGLHEPLGLLREGDDYLVAQRTEVTRLRNVDDDPLLERYETMASGWGVSGNYHEYAYGPERDGNGDLWVTLNIGMGEKAERNAAWRGWALRMNAEGEWQPVCAGMRSPSGLGTNLAGDLFATDQQGDWIGTCSLLHLRPGAFFGHPKSLQSAGLEGSPLELDPQGVPSGLPWPEALERVPGLTAPAVWFPYKKAGQSATDVVCDRSEGGFGPFAGQLFVGEFRLSGVLRVALEKVNGQYQGAVFPFRTGLACGVVRLEFGEDGSLFAGMTNRGWSSLGHASYGLQRLVWTGETPFEIHHIEATRDGFELVFTKEVAAESLEAGEALTVESYTYLLHQRYGSDEVLRESHGVTCRLDPDDPKRLGVIVEGLREGFVYEIRCGGLRSSEGGPLVHEDAYYTLNEIPVE